VIATLTPLPAIELAPLLIGATLLVDGVGGVIVETEAYEADDPASHSFAGERPRNRAMFGPPLTAYVYRSYGVHWCVNIVTGPVGHGAAVLLRAIEPTAGLAVMAERRRTAEPRLLASGPGRLTEALGISIAHDGLPLDAPPFELIPRQGTPDIVAGPRIGITKAADRPWRFGLRGSRFLSRPFR
jgi:DNA-3-methyladenine glycosylase